MEKAIAFQNKASVLMFPTTSKIPGTFSGKIFEYISSGIPIVASPMDIEAVCDLLKETKTGLGTDTAVGVKDFLESNYLTWKKYGDCWNYNCENNIIKYSRESQTKKLADVLHSI